MSKIHLLSDSSVEWLRQQAKKLRKKNSVSQSQALNEIAIEQGFLNWKHLIDTFKYEISSSRKNRVVTHYSSSFEPIRLEAYGLYISLLNQAVSDLNINTNQNVLWTQAHLDTSQKHGFADWESLKIAHIKEEITLEYTDEQKIGAIARNLKIDPKGLQNVVYVTVDFGEELFSISNDEFELLGFYEDIFFPDWLEAHDQYFKETGVGGKIFRILSIDTDSYTEVNKHLDKIAAKIERESFYPIHFSFIWINGKIDPIYLKADPDYPDDPLPSAILPETLWKRGY